MIQIIIEKLYKETIDTSRPLVENIFGFNNVLTFVNNLIDFQPIIAKILNNNTPDKSTVYFYKGRNIAAKIVGKLYK